MPLTLFSLHRAEGSLGDQGDCIFNQSSGRETRLFSVGSSGSGIDFSGPCFDNSVSNHLSFGELSHQFHCLFDRCPRSFVFVLLYFLTMGECFRIDRVSLGDQGEVYFQSIERKENMFLFSR